jgi:hypothetical protein
VTSVALVLSLVCETGLAAAGTPYAASGSHAAGVADEPPAGAGCSVPLDHCAQDSPAPPDYYRHIDYGWIPQPANLLESRLLAEPLRIPPLLQMACEPVSESDRYSGGESPLTHVVAKAGLLRLIERPEGLAALRTAFTGRPPLKDVGGAYRSCLNRLATPGWSAPQADPDTSPGWHEVVADIEAVPALGGIPGTSEVPACRSAGDWDVTMALVMRVFGLLEPFPPHIPPLVDVPETENHAWLIRSTRFLHNEMLPMIHFADYPTGDEVEDYSVDENPDNVTNGMANAMAVQMDQVRVSVRW